MTDIIKEAREALKAYDGNHTRRESLAELSPDLARLALAAEELAEALKECRDELLLAHHDQFDGVWSDDEFRALSEPYDTVLAAFEAIAKGGEP